MSLHGYNVKYIYIYMVLSTNLKKQQYISSNHFIYKILSSVSKKKKKALLLSQTKS